MTRTGYLLTAVLAVLAVAARTPRALAGPTLTVKAFSGSVTNNNAPFVLQNINSIGPYHNPPQTGFTHTYAGYTLKGGFGSSGAGIYSGGTLSPFSTTDNYLVAPSRDGLITLTYTTSIGSLDATSFGFVWSHVNSTSPSTLTRLVFGPSAHRQNVTTASIAAAYNAPLTSNNVDLSVQISGLQPFNSVGFANFSSSDFAFAPGVPVPEPNSLVILGGGLLGLVLVIRKRGRDWRSVR